MKALSLSAQRRRNQVVILSSFNLSKSLTSRHSFGKADAVRLCRKALSLAFCQTATMVVLAVAGLVMWWHNLSITDTLEAQRAVGFDCLLAFPWLIAMFFNLDSKKGGKK